MTEDWGRIMAIRRARAAETRAGKAPVSKPKTGPGNAPKMAWYPMRSHDGSVPDRPIDWSANAQIMDELSDRLRRSPFVVLVLPTGVGKTLASLQSFDAYRKKVGRDVPVTVLAPPKVVKDGNWTRAIQAFNNEHPDRPIDPVMIESPQRFLRIVNHPQTKRDFVKEMGKHGVFIVDEVHMFKNPTSKQTKALTKFPHLRKIGLTGTPLTNDPVMDQISYLVLAGKYNSKTAFERETGLGDFKDKFGRLTIYNKQTGRVNRQAWPYYDEMLKELSSIIYSPNVDISTLMMPEVSEHTRVVSSEELDNRWRSLVRAAKDGAFSSSADYLMACTETILIDEKRLDELVDLVRLGAHQPLVFYQHKVARDAIAQRFEQEGISFGERSGERDTLDKTSADPILVQYQSGGTGIELPDSEASIFYENQGSYMLLRQAQGRNVRRGRDHHVNHYYMVALNNFDMKVYEGVMSKEELNEEMLIEILNNVTE